jgi:CRP/FNR family cyclic AMP-dependent transcriptional regulator
MLADTAGNLSPLSLKSTEDLYSVQHHPRLLEAEGHLRNASFFDSSISPRLRQLRQVKLSCTSKDGKTLILKIAMAGDVLGLGAVISGSPFEVTAETVEPTEIKYIRRADFLSFIQKHSQATLHVAKAFSEEYKAVFFDARRLALSGSAAGKLAAVLLDWGRAASCGKPEMRFTMALTHEELANLVGSSRETVTRKLGRFKRERERS